LFYDRIRAADKARRQHAADIGSPSFAGDIARIQLQQRIAHPRPHRKDRPSRLLERLLRLLVGIGKHDVGAVDDLFGGWRPAVMGTLLAVQSGGFGHDLEWRERDAEADMVARRKFTGFGAGAERVRNWMRLLQRARPHRNSAIME